MASYILRLAKNLEGLQRHLIRIQRQVWEDSTRRNEALSRIKQLDNVEDTRSLLEDEARV